MLLSRAILASPSSAFAEDILSQCRRTQQSHIGSKHGRYDDVIWIAPEITLAKRFGSCADLLDKARRRHNPTAEIDPARLHQRLQSHNQLRQILADNRMRRMICRRFPQ